MMGGCAERVGWKAWAGGTGVVRRGAWGYGIGKRKVGGGREGGGGGGGNKGE